MAALNRKDSLSFLLLRLVAGALAAGVLFFYFLSFAGDYLVASWYQNSDYVERREREYTENLQDYVADNGISIKDGEKITEWVKEQKILALKIYQNQWLVYDSYYLRDMENLTEEEREQKYNPRENYYPVRFPDGNGEAIFYGAYQYQLYNFVMILELLAAFFLFLGLVLWGVRRKMDYIRQLGREIQILEGGDLEYPITVEGKDELAVLAKGLEAMRCSLKEQMEQEAQIAKANQEIVTEMSHDLRTPLTSILLYTEILRKGKEISEEKLQEYLRKIDEKARRLKQLSDHLFRYALVAGEESPRLEKPEQYREVFYDLLSETCSYLEEKGFQTEVHMDWEAKRIRADRTYVVRILDNITSNIVKYACKNEPVVICCDVSCGAVRLTFVNGIGIPEGTVESTRIGLVNVKNMMERMGGTCRTEQSRERFSLTLLFPCI